MNQVQLFLNFKTNELRFIDSFPHVVLTQFSNLVINFNMSKHILLDNPSLPPASRIRLLVVLTKVVVRYYMNFIRDNYTWWVLGQFKTGSFQNLSIISNLKQCAKGFSHNNQLLDFKLGKNYFLLMATLCIQLE